MPDLVRLGLALIGFAVAVVAAGLLSKAAIFRQPSILRNVI